MNRACFCMDCNRSYFRFGVVGFAGLELWL